MSSLITTTCPVCSHYLAAPFFDAGTQPLATLGWPASATQAQAMPSHPQMFVQCPACTHIWNHQFSYDAIPYQSHPNRMFNKGSVWKGHLAETGMLLAKQLPHAPCVVDVGCGEGHFVRALSELYPGRGRFLGFDPSATPEAGQGVEFHADYFQPLQHMAEFQPDAIVIRHVLEHLTDPAVLLEQMAWGATQQDKPCWLLAEVPCIDRAIETRRLTDFFYEHPSQFTSLSFRTLMQHAGEIVELAYGYGQEVVYALVKLGVSDEHKQRVLQTNNFFAQTNAIRSAVKAQLDALANSQKTIAIWGGTGKAAAFMHQYGADAKRFPLVVDSDPEKCGTFVPGTGQEIVFRDVLNKQSIDIVIIPSQWRAGDIVLEMEREGIRPPLILIEHNGRLIDFRGEEHPYK
jgi:hypothetical protein